ncbi:hypothetical protein BDZ90DRAFT_228434 [Jaminaea rosea]|uniref:Uncharacterized protein n=1 Tax=Jaminaea rosea TaxID=1569628 RepID=A0A316ULZ6_9BASI|nr:hypothetical protein BDZ90DRAFT_228434 [Jaminaea rosea]PWN25401.1 hypothetical protein BDZ90DRAFT_228434 [Jaminaea rosea]
MTKRGKRRLSRGSHAPGECCTKHPKSIANLLCPDLDGYKFALPSLSYFWILPEELRTYILSLACAASCSSSLQRLCLYLDLQTTANLSAVCRDFQAVFKPLLFGNIRLDRPSSLERFVVALQSAPQNGELVHSLHMGPVQNLPCQWWPVDDFCFADVFTLDEKEPLLKTSLTQKDEAARLPRWCKPEREWDWHLEAPDCEQRAVHDAVAAATEQIDVYLYDWSLDNGCEVSMNIVQAALDLYLMEMKHIEDARGYAVESWKVETPQTGNIPAQCLKGKCGHYPRLLIAGSRRDRQTKKEQAASGLNTALDSRKGDMGVRIKSSQFSNKKTRKEFFTITPSQLNSHLARPGAASDNFHNPLIIARSELHLLTVDAPSRVVVDWTCHEECYSDIEDDDDCDCAQCGGEEKLYNKWPHGRFDTKKCITLSAASTASFCEHGLDKTTINGILKLAQSVLDAVPSLANLSLTSFLHRSLWDLQQPRLSSLRFFSLGPLADSDDDWLDYILSTTHTVLPQVEYLRLCAVDAGETMAWSIAGQLGGLLPRLREAHWELDEPHNDDQLITSAFSPTRSIQTLRIINALAGRTRPRSADKRDVLSDSVRNTTSTSADHKDNIDTAPSSRSIELHLDADHLTAILAKLLDESPEAHAAFSTGTLLGDSLHRIKLLRSKVAGPHWWDHGDWLVEDGSQTHYKQSVQWWEDRAMEVALEESRKTEEGGKKETLGEGKIEGNNRTAAGDEQTQPSFADGGSMQQSELNEIYLRAALFLRALSERRAFFPSSFLSNFPFTLHQPDPGPSRAPSMMTRSKHRLSCSSFNANDDSEESHRLDRVVEIARSDSAVDNLPQAHLHHFWLLPQELRHLILSLAAGISAYNHDTTVLFSLSLVSRDFHKQFDDLLYKQIRISRPNVLPALYNCLFLQPTNGKLIKSLHLGPIEPLSDTWWPLDGKAHPACLRPLLWIKTSLDGTNRRLPLPKWYKGRCGRALRCNGVPVNRGKRGGPMSERKESGFYEMSQVRKLKMVRGSQEAEPLAARHFTSTPVLPAPLLASEMGDRARALSFRPLSPNPSKPSFLCPSATTVESAQDVHEVKAWAELCQQRRQTTTQAGKGRNAKHSTLLPPFIEHFFIPINYQGDFQVYDHDESYYRFFCEGCGKYHVAPATDLDYGLEDDMAWSSGLTESGCPDATTLPGLLALCRGVLLAMPHMTNLPLTGSMIRPLKRNSPPLQALRFLSLGPWTEAPEDQPTFASTRFSSLQKLRVCGEGSEGWPLHNIVAQEGRLLPQLREMQWDSGRRFFMDRFKSFIDALKGRAQLSSSASFSSPSAQQMQTQQQQQQQSSSSSCLFHFRISAKSLELICREAPSAEARSAWLQGIPYNNEPYRILLVESKAGGTRLGRAEGTVQGFDILYEETQRWWRACAEEA